MNTKLAGFWVAAAAALATALLIATPASAQVQGQATFQVDTIDAPPAIKVDVETVTITVNWKYSYTSTAVAGQNPAFSTATLTWEQPTCEGKGVLITGALSQSFAIPAQASAEVKGLSKFNVKVTDQAPGETSVTCTFKGKVGKVGSLDPTLPSESTVPITARYYGQISAAVPTTIAQTGPQKQITYVITVTNFGNSDSYINFALKNEVPEGWQPVTPVQFTLGSLNKGATTNSQTVNFLVSTPYKNGWNNKETTFQIEVQPSSAKQPEEKGNAITINVLARVRGIYVPGPEPALMMLAAVGTALVVRKLGRDEE